MAFRTVFPALLLLFLFCAGWAIAQTGPAPVVAPWTQKYDRLSLRENSESDFKETPPPKIIKKSRKVEEPEEDTPQGTKQFLSVPSQKTKPSAIETMYSARIVDELSQFGYDMFGVPDESLEAKLDGAGGSIMPMGEVQDDFILSSGDELEIVFTGQKTGRALYKINSRGLLLIPDFPPIPAEGRTIGQVRISVAAAAGNLYNTETYVALASVRQIGILVIGHVKLPGRQTLTVFHTLLDALMASGGIQKTGSLRQIKLVRNGRSMMVDLYALLLHGSTNMDLRLKDGDRIIVPAIGPTVAVAGEIKRPGIYEILPGVSGMLHKPENKSEKLTLDEMLELGGGVLAPGQNRFLELEVTPQGKEKVSEVHEAFDPLFGDGSILMISKGTEKRAGTVELQGEGIQEGRSGNTRRIKVNFQETAPQEIMIGAGDAIRVNQKFRKVQDKSVLVIGEVHNPGRYDLLPGDKVSDLLERAGGLTDQAYADGAIFSRESERMAEEARFRSQAAGIKRAISAALSEDDKKIDTGKIEEVRGLAAELENAQGVGRITVEADPAMLKVTPELDMLLESGDRLYVPKRSLTVRVSGEILSPASLMFREKKTPLDYIHEAGGFTFNADTDRTFVLFPDGSAQPLQVSAWNHSAAFIPPGSTIVVPRDPKPFDFIEGAKDLSQILSNLAVTAIFVNDVRNDD